MANESAFTSDNLSFCPQCGTFLPLSGLDSHVSCIRCGFKRPITDYEGVPFEAQSRKHAFQKPKFNTTKAEKSVGTAIQERCPECGRDDQMTFTTAQLRSADEGQTIFYSCKCGHKFSLNS